MKKGITSLVLFIATLFFTLNSFAIIIYNNNDHKIRYKILHDDCGEKYAKGGINAYDQISWEGNAGEEVPRTVCIWARGKKSLTGTYCAGIPTLGTTVEVTNSGPDRGVKCECTAGCD